MGALDRQTYAMTEKWGSSSFCVGKIRKLIAFVFDRTKEITNSRSHSGTEEHEDTEKQSTPVSRGERGAAEARRNIQRKKTGNS